MAKSPSHKLGQFVGDVVEAAIEEPLQAFADEHGLYLDTGGRRKARNNRKSLKWEDEYGNKHTLDCVIEEGGTEENFGTPVAFIEAAWRRYTKHSRNKAQEIQGAVRPLAQTYSHVCPFKGAALAGVFTEGSLNQLKSHGFHILFFSYDSVIEAFDKYGADVEFDEDTPEDELLEKVQSCNMLTQADLDNIGKTLLDMHSDDVAIFFEALREKVVKKIARVVVLPLFGDVVEFDSIIDAIQGLDDIKDLTGSETAQGYEAIVEYSNGDRIDGRFQAVEGVEKFLKAMLSD